MIIQVQHRTVKKRKSSLPYSRPLMDKSIPSPTSARARVSASDSFKGQLPRFYLHKQKKTQAFDS